MCVCVCVCGVCVCVPPVKGMVLHEMKATPLYSEGNCVYVCVHRVQIVRFV